MIIVFINNYLTSLNLCCHTTYLILYIQIWKTFILFVATSKYLKLLSLTKSNFKILKGASILDKLEDQDVLESSLQDFINNWMRENGV